MNCLKVQELLIDYAEGALVDRKRLRVERHLSQCETCRSELSRIEKLKESILSLKAPEREAEFWHSFNKRLSQKLADEGRARTVRSYLSRPGLSFAAAATVALVFILGLVVLPRLPERRETIRELASETGRAETIGIDDFEPELFNTYAYDEIKLALADLSSEEIEQVAESVLPLIEEDWQPSSDDLVLDVIYEQDIYEFLEDLTFEEYEEIYEALESI